MNAWKDAPAWVFEAAKLEDWEWQDWDEWERLRVQFAELDFELKETGSLATTGVLIIAALRPDCRRLSVRKEPDVRLLAALHKLCLDAKDEDKRTRGK